MENKLSETQIQLSGCNLHPDVHVVELYLVNISRITEPGAPPGCCDWQLSNAVTDQAVFKDKLDSQTLLQLDKPEWLSVCLASEIPVGKIYLQNDLANSSTTTTHGIFLTYWTPAQLTAGLSYATLSNVGAHLYRETSYKWTYLLCVCFLLCAIYLYTHYICLLIFFWLLFSGYGNESEFRNDTQLDFACLEGFLDIQGSLSIWLFLFFSRPSIESSAQGGLSQIVD